MTNLSPEEETPLTPPARRRDASLVWAVLLIAVGVVLLVTQFVSIAWGALLWPLWILVPGIGLLILGFTLGRTGAEPLVVVGSILSAVGAILFYANATGHWTVWTYAWALIAPTSIGAGLWILGSLRQRPDLTSSGKAMVKIGMGLFAAFGVFFELVIGVSGWGLQRYTWAILLIAAGILLLVRSLWWRPRPKQ